VDVVVVDVEVVDVEVVEVDVVVGVVVIDDVVVFTVVVEVVTHTKALLVVPGQSKCSTLQSPIGQLTSVPHSSQLLYCVIIGMLNVLKVESEVPAYAYPDVELIAPAGCWCWTL
jgi:hypothetical protein